MAGANVDDEGAERAGFTDQLGKSLRVRGHFAAEVSPADAELRASTDQAIAPVVEDLLRAFLAEGLVDGSHKGVVALIHIGVALTLGNEDERVRVPEDGLLDHDAIAIVATVSVGDFFGDGFGFGSLFWFQLGDVNIEIAGLSLQGRRSEENGHTDAESRKGLFPRHKSSLIQM